MGSEMCIRDSINTGEEMDIKVRLAGTGDVPQLLKIYEQYIDTPITFEYTLPTRQDFTKRILS